MCFTQERTILTLSGKPLKLALSSIHLSNKSSTERNVNLRPAKVETAIDRLLVVRESDQIKLDFFRPS